MPRAPALQRAVQGRIPLVMTAHVTSAGKTPKAAVVKTTFQTYDPFLKTHGTIRQKLHISDPTSSLHTHDVVRITRFPYLSKSKNIAYTVTKILAPWGPPLSKRPALLTTEERAARRAKQVLKRGGEGAERLLKGETVVGWAGSVKEWWRLGGGLKKTKRIRAGEEEGEKGSLQAESWTKGGTPPRGVWYTDEENNLRQLRPGLLEGEEVKAKMEAGAEAEAEADGEELKKMKL